MLATISLDTELRIHEVITPLLHFHASEVQLGFLMVSSMKPDLFFVGKCHQHRVAPRNIIVWTS